MTYKIKVTVEGGVTGYRTAYLKANGEEREFETREDAQQVVNALSERTANQTASYRYMVEEQ